MYDGGMDAAALDVLYEDNHCLAIAKPARPLVRLVAAAFDQYLGQGAGRHSRAV